MTPTRYILTLTYPDDLGSSRSNFYGPHGLADAYSEAEGFIEDLTADETGAAVIRSYAPGGPQGVVVVAYRTN